VASAVPAVLGSKLHSWEKADSAFYTDCQADLRQDLCCQTWQSDEVCILMLCWQ
jgi:hypothetical protein